jgi:hypothetical protein
MKDDDFFDQDLEPDTTPAPVDTGLMEDNVPATEQTAPEESISDGLTVTGAHAVSSAPAAKPAWEFMGYGWKAWVGFAALFTGMTAFALWPDAPPPRAVSAPLIDAATVVSSHPPPPASDLTGTSSAAGFDQLQRDMTALMRAQQQYSQQNRADIAALTRRLDAANQQIAALTAREAAQDARLATLAAHPSTVPANTTSPPSRHHRTHTPSALRASTAGWSVNTVYPGMAWLRHGNSTWAVQPGDTLQGLHITAVDVPHRTVITDHGVIH